MSRFVTGSISRNSDMLSARPWRLATLATVGLALGMSACGDARRSSASSALAAASTVDQDSSDIATLRGGLEERISVSGGEGSTVVDLGRCQRQSPATNSPYTLFECTAEIERIGQAPALGPVWVRALETSPGNFSSEFFCRLTNVETVTKLVAVDSPVFSGIGFFSDLAGGDYLIAKSRLREVGRVHLKGGTPAVVHRFVGLGACWLGSPSASAYAITRFKAFAAFDTQHTIYRNWEQVGHNHGLGYFYPRFDRTTELLDQ